jgi:CBS domain-containing protein
MRHAARCNVGKDETNIRASSRSAKRRWRCPFRPIPRLMTSMRSARTAAHSDIQPEHLVARATAERKFVSLLRSPQRVFPVVENGQLVGVVGLADVRRLERSAWGRARVLEIMTPREKLRVARSEDDALDTLATLSTSDVNQLPVMEGASLGS